MYDRVVDVPRLVHTYAVGETLPHPALEGPGARSRHYRPSSASRSYRRLLLLPRRPRLRRLARRHIGRGDRRTRWSRSSRSATRAGWRCAPGAAAASIAFTMGHGDLLVMGGSCQRTWEHAVPKTAPPARASPCSSDPTEWGKEPTRLLLTQRSVSDDCQQEPGRRPRPRRVSEARAQPTRVGPNRPKRWSRPGPLSHKGESPLVDGSRQSRDVALTHPDSNPPRSRLRLRIHSGTRPTSYDESPSPANGSRASQSSPLFGYAIPGRPVILDSEERPRPSTSDGAQQFTPTAKTQSADPATENASASGWPALVSRGTTPRTRTTPERRDRPGALASTSASSTSGMVSMARKSGPAEARSSNLGRWKSRSSARDNP